MSKNFLIYLLGAGAIAGIAASSYFAIEGRDQKAQIDSLQQDRNLFLNQTKQKEAELAIASSTITKLQNEIESIKEDLDDLADDYRDEKNRNEDFEDQIRSLSGTLGDLDKLAKLDKQLLAKYSKVYFLNENYTPSKLKEIDSQYIQEGKGDLYFHASAINHLEDMLDAAKKDDIDLQIVSAYRSFDEQTNLKGQHTQVYGSGANTFSADQGYSEHQLGTTVDLTVKSVGGTYTSFGDTAAFAWLEDNAHKYGFILSYPEGNDFYVYEPWHWRFVGTDLARHLDRSDETFYTMDQREIDDYLLEIFD